MFWWIFSQSYRNLTNNNPKKDFKSVERSFEYLKIKNKTIFDYKDIQITEYINFIF